MSLLQNTLNAHISVDILCTVRVSFEIVVHVCAGVGPSLSPTRIRALLALRINVLAKGYSGISLRTLHQYIDAFNGWLIMVMWPVACTGLVVVGTVCVVLCCDYIVDLDLVCSIMSTLGARAGYGRSQWWPGSHVTPRTGHDGRGHDVESREWLGWRQIRKSCRRF